jgi:hypothetical protein
MRFPETSSGQARRDFPIKRIGMKNSFEQSSGDRKTFSIGKIFQVEF